MYKSIESRYLLIPFKCRIKHPSDDISLSLSPSMHAYAHTYIHTYIFINIRTYIHTYTYIPVIMLVFISMSGFLGNYIWS